MRYGYYVTVDRHARKGLAMTRVVITQASGNCDLLPCSFLSSPFNLHSSIFQTFLDDPAFHACEYTEVGLNDVS